MKLSIQTLREKFKAVVFETNGMKNPDVSTLIAILPVLANQDFDSNICTNFSDF